MNTIVSKSETKVKDTTNGLYVDTDIELGDDGETISYYSGHAHSSSSKVCLEYHSHTHVMEGGRCRKRQEYYVSKNEGHDEGKGKEEKCAPNISLLKLIFTFIHSIYLHPPLPPPHRMRMDTLLPI